MDRARIGHSSAAKTYLHPETWTAFWNQGLKRSLEVLGFASLTVQSQRILSPLGWQNQTVVCASWQEELRRASSKHELRSNVIWSCDTV